MSTVMGVDSSTKGFAFAVINDKGELIKYGKIDFAGGGVFNRLNDAQKKLTAIKSEFPEVDLVVFEAATFIQNKKTVILMAMALGATLPVFMDSDVTVKDIPPITWQNYIGNKSFTKKEKEQVKEDNPGKSASWYQTELRRIRKDRTRKWVNNKFNVDSPVDDVTDAIAIAFVGWDQDNAET